MDYSFCLPCMVFCHIIDDYYLQGILANLKQKSYWGKLDGYNNFYKYDYIAALLFHGFSWAFMILLPLVIFYQSNLNITLYLILLISQALLHAFIDNEKANRKRINLVIDQSLHMIQIFLSWLILYFI